MESSSIAPVGRRSNEALGSCASGLLLDFLAVDSYIASESARAPRFGAPSPFARMPVLVVDHNSKPMTAIPGKLFVRAGVLGIIPHLQPAQCTRSTYAHMAGGFTYEPGRTNSFPVIPTPVLT